MAGYLGEFFGREIFLRARGVLSHMGPIGFYYKTHLGGLGILSLGHGARQRGTVVQLSHKHC